MNKSNDNSKINNDQIPNKNNNIAKDSNTKNNLLKSNIEKSTNEIVSFKISKCNTKDNSWENNYFNKLTSKVKPITPTVKNSIETNPEKLKKLNTANNYQIKRLQQTQYEKMSITNKNTLSKQKARSDFSIIEKTNSKNKNTEARKIARDKLPNIIKQETKKTDTAARIEARAILPIQIKKETKIMDTAAREEARAILPTQIKKETKIMDTAAREEARSKLTVENQNNITLANSEARSLKREDPLVIAHEKEVLAKNLVLHLRNYNASINAPCTFICSSCERLWFPESVIIRSILQMQNLHEKNHMNVSTLNVFLKTYYNWKGLDINDVLIICHNCYSYLKLSTKV